MKFGITERGDAGVDFSWTDKLLDLNIVISKVLNDKLIDALIEKSKTNNIIFHCTCTGWGGTDLEKNVFTKYETFEQLQKLIDKGFAKNKIVLRVDPIIPTIKGIVVAENVLKLFMIMGVKRVKFSFLDMYTHVAKRMIENKIRHPYTSFSAPIEMTTAALEMIKKCEKIYDFESCAENTPYSIGCISQKDLDLFGLNTCKSPCGAQRKGCLCLSGKTELLTNKKRCPNGCLYCYWRD